MEESPSFIQPDSQTEAWKTIVESTAVEPANGVYALVYIHHK
jgi:hypothetical protein